MTSIESVSGNNALKDSIKSMNISEDKRKQFNTYIDKVNVLNQYQFLRMPSIPLIVTNVFCVLFMVKEIKMFGVMDIFNGDLLIEFH